MTDIKNSAIALTKHLQQFHWFMAVGIDGEKLIIYTTVSTTKELAELRRIGWEGFEVDFKKTGRIRPAAH